MLASTIRKSSQQCHRILQRVLWQSTTRSSVRRYTTDNKTAIIDVDKTPIVAKLLDVARENRNEQWLAQFTENIPTAAMASASPQVLRGPDNFDYFVLQTPSDQEFDAFSLAHALESTIEHGLGVVVDPQRNDNCFVFSYGDLWAYKEFGSFYAENALQHIDDANQLFDTEAMQPTHKVLPESQQSVLVGKPSSKLLPEYVKRHIFQCMKSLMNVAEPDIILVAQTADANTGAKSSAAILIVNVHPEEYNPTNDEKQPEEQSESEASDLKQRQQQYLQNAIMALRWYLPRSYSVIATDRATYDFLRSPSNE